MANGRIHSLESGFAASQDYSVLHHRFYVSQDMMIRDAFQEYLQQKLAFEHQIINVILGPYLFAACSFDFGAGLDGAYGQAINLLTTEVAYEFSLSRHAIYVPCHYSTSHDALFIGDGFVPYHLTSGEKAKDQPDIFSVLPQLAKKLNRQIYGVGFHPDGRQVVLSMFKGVLQVWDMYERRHIKTLSK